MTTLLKTFWAKLNYPAELLDSLMTPDPEGEPSEDYPDAVELANTFKTTQEKLILDSSGLFTKEHMDQEFEKHRISLAAEISKKLGLQMSRADIKELGWKKFVDQASETVKDSIQKASKATDDSLKDEIRTLQEEKIAAIQEKERLEDEIETRVQTKTKVLQQELNSFAVDHLFDVQFKELPFPDSHADVYQDYIRNQIESKYEIHKDGRLTQDEGKDAVNFEGNGYFKTVGEAVKYIYETKKMNPKHKGGKGGAGGSTHTVLLDGSVIDGELSENAAAMQNRFKEVEK